jgi:hypothetical protein
MADPQHVITQFLTDPVPSAQPDYRIGEPFQIVPIANWVEIKACEKFYRRHMVDIPRIKFFA